MRCFRFVHSVVYLFTPLFATLMLAQAPLGPPLPRVSPSALGQARLTPTKLQFGKVAVGEKSKTNTLTVFNGSRSGLTIIDLTIRPDVGDFSLVNTCGSSVAAGETCYITVTFTPTARGSRTADLVFDTVPATSQTVTLTGIGK